MTERPVSVKDIKTGSYVMIDDEPCRVTDVAISKPGKHGSTKARIEGMGLFDNKKHYLLKQTSADVYVPIIEKKRGQVISISGDVAQLMNLEDYSTFEAIIPEEFKGKIEPGQEIGYWKIGNRVIIKG